MDAFKGRRFGPFRLGGDFILTRIVCISDTHTLHDQVSIPDGDILIHAGDLTNRGSFQDVVDFNNWLGQLPHRHKIIIAGNHDFCFERNPQESQALVTNATYLQDSNITIGGLKIYGSPWQPWFYDWAFNLRRGEPLRLVWSLIPEDTDILITHGPPLGQGDMTERGVAVGCEELEKRIQTVQPRLHVFGHIHEGYGTTQKGKTTFVNASTCNARYEPVNPPVVIDL